MVCLVPRVPGEIVGPRRPCGVVSRPLDFVRWMSTAIPHRAVELLIGVALLGYCAYQIYVGEAFGSFRSYAREERPWTYWTSILLQLAITAAFLFGFTAWRN